MQNKWTASVSKKDTAKDVQSPTPEKNNSKKIGLVMGIVGAVLVTAGAAPMLFENSENLTGDITEQAEATDPLVALLSGGNTTAEVKTTQTNKPTPVATVKPAATAKTVVAKATPKPTAQVTTSDKTVKVTNANTGTTDKKGEKFHNASALVNTSNQNTQVKTGNTSTSITADGVSVKTGNTSASITAEGISVKTGNASVQTTIKPPRNIQTGLDSNMMMGLLFLLASGALLIRSRKTA